MPFARTFLTAGLAFAALAGPAQGATVSLSGATITYDAAAGDVDRPLVAEAGADIEVKAQPGGATITAGSGCAAIAGGASCPKAGVTDVKVDLKDHGDDLDAPLPAAFKVTATGGPGDDVLRGGAAADSLDGGEDSDTLDGRLGGDQLTGGPGYGDRVDYGSRANPVTAAIGGAGGEAGEDDAIGADVEDLTGGAGADKLTGSDAANVLDGGGAGDQLFPGGGPDIVLGAAGDDAILSTDGVVDAIRCGEGSDESAGDSFDEYDGCEADKANRSPAMQPDQDGDGVAAPLDCRDHDPVIHPGATDYFDNGLDEDCDGKDAVNFDVDGDGFASDIDCNDRDRNIKPTAREIYDNDIDENCDRKTPAAKLQRINVNDKWTALARGGLRLTTLRVIGAEIDTDVEVTCKGSTCPSKKENATTQRTREPLDFTQVFNKRVMKAGTVLTVRVSKTGGYTTRVYRYKLRNHKLPVEVQSCIKPGETKEAACRKASPKKKKGARR